MRDDTKKLKGELAKRMKIAKENKDYDEIDKIKSEYRTFLNERRKEYSRLKSAEKREKEKTQKFLKDFLNPDD